MCVCPVLLHALKIALPCYAVLYFSTVIYPSLCSGAGGEVEEVPRGRGHKTTGKRTKGGGRKKSSPGGGGGSKGMQMDIAAMFAKW